MVPSVVGGTLSMPGIQHRTLAVNGLRMHVAEQGQGPLVLLCHGFPEGWYSYRHQLHALAAAGYHAVAPDMRGYGQTERPDAVERYGMLHLVGDMIALIGALEAESAVIVGHDWGGPVAWLSALLRPDRIRGVVGLSTPFRPPGLPLRPTALMPQTPEALFYILYFQQPGVAEAELERDPRESVLRLFYGASGEVPRERIFDGMVPRHPPASAGGGFLRALGPAPRLPAWLTERDLDVYAAEFTRTGFAGGLNWYRNIDRNAELLAPFSDLRIQVPALFIAGELDPVVRLPNNDRLVAELGKHAPQLRRTLLLPGCGHWTQQERPQEVNAALLEFLASL